MFVWLVSVFLEKGRVAWLVSCLVGWFGGGRDWGGLVWGCGFVLGGMGGFFCFLVVFCSFSTQGKIFLRYCVMRRREYILVGDQRPETILEEIFLLFY